MGAEWATGVAVTALSGVGPLVRMAVSADVPGMAAWAGGALFIPSFALVLGTLSRTHRMFRAVYAALNRVAFVDYMGVVLRNGLPAGQSPLLTAGLALALPALTFAVRAVRHATR
ncbi:hypothetical protein [Rhizohabitans arisaemae]|uniref:hypothetical protein n=1 Tax=Rhizohabitans arisaemae TaxID=2720610 RepID=UPI0024B22811|nr:hypothetical protein [Rhizohabitans arisaemae]